MIEKKWRSLAPVAFTATGTNRGKIKVTSTFGFKVKMVVVIQNPSQPTLQLQVKRVNSKTEMELGPCNGSIEDRSDLSSYNNTSFIYANEQNRPSIPLHEIERGVYEEEPTVAIRTYQVDEWGNPYTVDNPLPVQLSDGNINIENLNANVEVQLTAKDNDPKNGDIHDSIRIGDGTNELAINPDGSINFRLISANSEPGLNTFYNEVSAVPSGVETTVLSIFANPTIYPSGIRITKIEASGENVAQFKVKIDSNTFITKRNWWCNWNVTFNFEDFEEGIKINAGQTLIITAIHLRPLVANFEATAYSLQ